MLLVTGSKDVEFERYNIYQYLCSYWVFRKGGVHSQLWRSEDWGAEFENLSISFGHWLKLATMVLFFQLFHVQDGFRDLLKSQAFTDQLSVQSSRERLSTCILIGTPTLDGSSSNRWKTRGSQNRIDPCFVVHEMLLLVTWNAFSRLLWSAASSRLI